MVVVGGTALNHLGVVERATRDVGVIATGTLQPEGPPTGIQPPAPALRPTAEELAAAQAWISRTQDPSPTMAGTLGKVSAYVLTTDR